MEPIDMTRIDGAPAETPDRERLDELHVCFECGALLAPDAEHGSTVVEGMVLCADCCSRTNEDDAPPTLRLPPSWYEDMAGERHHT